MAKERYTLARLAAVVGLSPRTVHYYVTLGLLQRPVERGRYAFYSDRHLERLRTIVRLKHGAYTLAEIRRRIARSAKERALRGIGLRSFAVDANVVVHVNTECSPQRLSQIVSAITELSRRLGDGPPV